MPLTTFPIGLDNIKLRNVLLAICALINGGIIAFSIITSARMPSVNNAILLIMLVVCSFIAVFDITWTWGKKE